MLISSNSTFSLAVLGHGNFLRFFISFLLSERILCFSYVASHFCILWQVLSLVLEYFYLYLVYRHCFVIVLVYNIYFGDVFGIY